MTTTAIAADNVAIHLILGAARSGKSRYGESLAAQSGKPVCYLATAQALDDEMRQRIEHHIQARPASWLTIEEPLHLAKALARLNLEQPEAVVLIDCLTLWVTNCLLHDNPKLWAQERAAFLTQLKQCPQPVLLISNEVGAGIVPMGELSRRFVDETGWLHQDIAAIAGRVSLVVAGIPLTIK